MNIILDTNVFISGIFFRGPPSDILQAWKVKRVQVVLTKQIFDEYQRVAQSLKNNFPTVDILPIINLMAIYGRLISSDDVSLRVCEDPDDDKFIECAVASGTGIIVSGDKHLLNITGYQGITVLKPRDFVDTFLR